MDDGERTQRYLRILLVLLVPAAFFNGFDGELRSLLLPQLQHTFHVRLATIGLANIPIGAGQFVAFFAIRLADRIGRRPLLLVSLFGYAAFTGCTAASQSVWMFALFQFFSQMFAGTEYALAVIVVLEEFPAARPRPRPRRPARRPGDQCRGGGGAPRRRIAAHPARLALLLPDRHRPGPRDRRRPPVHERDRHLHRQRLGHLPKREPVRAVFEPPWRRRVLGLGVVSLLVKIPVTAGAGWWVYYAEHERHFSTGLVALFLGVAFGLGTSGYYVCGWLIDRFGRRPIASIFLVCAFGAGFSLFQTGSKPANFALLLTAVFFGLGVGPALSALSAESFPTRIRAQASAIVGNGFANTGELSGPALVGLLGERGGLIGSVGGTVSTLAFLLPIAVPVLWWFVPETKGTDLSAVPGDVSPDPEHSEGNSRPPPRTESDLDSSVAETATTDLAGE